MKFFKILPLVLLLSIGGLLQAQTNAKSNFKTTNVVLVHGAFADASCYLEVMKILEKNGLHAVAVQNPLTSLPADVAATKRVIHMQKGPVVLVGHSYGGVVISEAGVDSQVTSLVYLAAIATDAGEVFGEVAKKYPATPGLATIKFDEGYLQLSNEGFVANFMQDVPADKAKLFAAEQAPVEATLFDQKINQAAWKNKPSWFAVAKMDRMIDPGLERFFAQRMKATTVEIASSHAMMVSQPKEVAELIMAAARGK